jgi:hypothetical protein
MIKKIALIEFLLGLSNGDQVTFKQLKEVLEGTESAKCCNPSEYTIKSLETFGYIKIKAEGFELLDLAGALTWLNRDPLNREAGKRGRFGKVSEGYEVVDKVAGWLITTNGDKIRVVSGVCRVGRVTFDLTYTPNGKIRNNNVKWELGKKSVAAVYAAEEVAKGIVKRSKK